MKAINIYGLTRVADEKNIKRLERQLSWRSDFLAVKKWEIDSARKLADKLYEAGLKTEDMIFYYSYQIPKLGKEFDLLRIADDYIINIELKSAEVADEVIIKQLVQNRYYLSALCRNVHSYTYVSSQNRLVRLSNSDHLVETDWIQLRLDLENQKNCCNDNIEELFKEEHYIISPLAEPDRFLRHDYFLTSQQRDIERRILKRIEEGGASFQGFTGAPGTGKTLLLYDIAMNLSEKQSICIFHCGAFSEELKRLDERLKRIDFFKGDIMDYVPDISKYSAILVDEGHRLHSELAESIRLYAKEHKLPVIFTYDSEENIAREELDNHVIDQISLLPNYMEYRLTNRIMTNGELSSFVHSTMKASRYNHRRNYPSVELMYANDEAELNNLLENYLAREYILLKEDNISRKEFDKVVMVMDEKFWYDHEGFLRCYRENDEKSRVRLLFHGLSRAKKNIALVVLNNEEVFDVLLSIVQGRADA